MIDAALNHVPVKHRVTTVACVLLAFGAAAAFEGGRASGSPVVHQTRVVKQTVAQQYGKPSQTLAGAQVNAGLKGLRCDVYTARKVVLCHP